MRVLFIGDVVGKPGREGLAAAMPALREEHLPDLVIVNGENAGGGVGITPETAEEIFDAGADVITLGNHTYRHREVYSYLNSEGRIIRPANFPEGNPGRGHVVVDAAGMKVAVVNLSGLLHLQVERSPFPVADEIIDQLEGRRRRRDRRLPRRADQREGRDGLAPRRPRRRGARHPHPRPHRRRPRPAGRHRRT